MNNHATVVSPACLSPTLPNKKVGESMKKKRGIGPFGQNGGVTEGLDGDDRTQCLNNASTTDRGMPSVLFNKRYPCRVTFNSQVHLGCPTLPRR